MWLNAHISKTYEHKVGMECYWKVDVGIALNHYKIKLLDVTHRFQPIRRKKNFLGGKYFKEEEEVCFFSLA